MSPIFARPVSCEHGLTDFEYDADDIVPKYSCGCHAVVVPREKIHVPSDEDFRSEVSMGLVDNLVSFITPPHGLMGHPNLGVPLEECGLVPNQSCRVILSFSVCYYDNDIINKVLGRDGFVVYCGLCYSAMENQERDFEPELTEDGYRAITFPEPTCSFDIEYEDETDENGTLYMQVDHRPAHVLASEDGIESGLELASKVARRYGLTYSCEKFCNHCYGSLMRVEYL